MSIKRIAPATITETLAEAMENADRFKHVIIIAETVTGDELSQMVFANKDMTLAQMNFLCDIVKSWTLSVARDAVEGDGT